MIAMNYSERIYVKVSADFDSTGFMMPRSIFCSDGREFTIDDVKDFYPAFSSGYDHNGDCYCIIIHGKQRYLFFEKISQMFDTRVGRWFVENQSN